MMIGCNSKEPWDDEHHVRHCRNNHQDLTFHFSRHGEHSRVEAQLSFPRKTIMRTLIHRIAKLRNTVSLQTFPRDLNLLYNWSGKTNVFFGMNHDFVRTCIVLQLLETLAVDAFVETGTHLGRTCFLIASQTN